MLRLTSPRFQERIPVSYSSEPGHTFLQTYIDFAKACIEEDTIPLIFN